jgi:gluconolactonase
MRVAKLLKQSAALRGIVVAAGVAFAATAVAADPGFPAPTGDSTVLPPGAKLDRVFDGACALTEGVAAGHDGMIYFSDITFTSMCKDPSGKYSQAGNIWKHNPRTGETTIFRSPSGMANGAKFDHDGNLLSALGADFGGRMLVKTDMKTGKSYILTGLFEGKSYNALNDLSIDEKGRVYFTDPRYLGHEPIEQAGFAVYRLDTDSSVHRIITDGGKVNGVQVSPDQKTLYVISNDNAWFEFQDLKPGEKTLRGFDLLLAYDLKPDGDVANRRVLIDYKSQGGPDGMTADVDGNLYVAVRDEGGHPGIYVYSPQGKQLAFIPTGNEMPTNVAFGYGDDASTLWVTSGRSLYRIKMAKKGYQLP